MKVSPVLLAILIALLLGAGLVGYFVHELGISVIVSDFCTVSFQLMDLNEYKPGHRVAKGKPALEQASPADTAVMLKNAESVYQQGLKMARREWNPSKACQRMLMESYIRFLRHHHGDSRADQIQTDLSQLK